jgi:hypothetical protein
MVLLETCTVSCQNKFVKLVHLVGFIIKKRSNLFALLHSNIYGHLEFKHWAVFPETNQTKQGKTHNKTMLKLRQVEQSILNDK